MSESESDTASGDHLDAQYPDRVFFEYRETFVGHLMATVAEHLDARKHEARCLDVGSNTGRYTHLLAQRGLRVEGVDFSDELLAKARSRHPEYTFQQGDAQNLPFKDDSYDGIISLGLIQMVPDWKAAVRETVRVLKPGGIAIIETNRRFPVWEYGLKHLWYCLSGRVSADERQSVLRAHQLGPDAPNGSLRKFSLHDLMDVLGECGGLDVRIHDPRKHGLLHDFIFALEIHKPSQRNCSSNRAVCKACARGIDALSAEEREPTAY